MSVLEVGSAGAGAAPALADAAGRGWRGCGRGAGDALPALAVSGAAEPAARSDGNGVAAVGSAGRGALALPCGGRASGEEAAGDGATGAGGGRDVVDCETQAASSRVSPAVLARARSKCKEGKRKAGQRPRQEGPDTGSCGRREPAMAVASFAGSLLAGPPGAPCLAVCCSWFWSGPIRPQATECSSPVRRGESVIPEGGPAPIYHSLMLSQTRLTLIKFRAGIRHEFRQHAASQVFAVAPGGRHRAGAGARDHHRP